MQANQKRRALDNELTETMTAQVCAKGSQRSPCLYVTFLTSEIMGVLSFKQMELDRAAEDFRRVHQERQEVIRQWENAIQQMQKRDQEIDHCALVKLL